MIRLAYFKKKKWIQTVAEQAKDLKLIILLVFCSFVQHKTKWMIWNDNFSGSAFNENNNFLMYLFKLFLCFSLFMSFCFVFLGGIRLNLRLAHKKIHFDGILNWWTFVKFIHFPAHIKM